jgi:ABC-type transporter Mla subunit MlaD
MSKEMKIGIVTSAGIACMFFFIIMFGDISFGSVRIYKVSFNRLDGLSTGSKVKIAEGIDVGEVDKLVSDGTGAIAVLKISNPNVHLTEQTIVKINAESLLGGKYVQIEGLDKGKKINENYVLKGKDPVSMSSVFSTIGETFGSGGGAAAGQTAGIINNISRLLNNANNLITTIDALIDNNKSELESIIHNVNNASKDLNKIITKMDVILDDSNNLITDSKKVVNVEVKNTLKDARSLMRNLKSNVNVLSDDVMGMVHYAKTGIHDVIDGKDSIKKITRNANRLIKKSDKGFSHVVKNLDNTLKTVDGFVDKISKVTDDFSEDMNQDGTTYSNILRDKELAKDLKETIKNLKQITNEVRNSFLFTNGKLEKSRVGPFDRRNF